MTASSSYDEESRASRSGPLPLPPRNTRPDYVDPGVITANASDTSTVSDISSIADTESDAQDEINDVNSEESAYWQAVDDFDFRDERLCALLSGLTMSTSNSTNPRENVIQNFPVAGPSTATLNLNLANPSVEVPFQGGGPFYVVTKGLDVGVFDDW